MARMSSARETVHRHWVDTRSLVGSRRLASAHRHSVPGAFHTARSWLKASHTVILRRLAKAAELPRHNRGQVPTRAFASRDRRYGSQRRSWINSFRTLRLFRAESVPYRWYGIFT